jgi:hypothetical protein
MSGENLHPNLGVVTNPKRVDYVVLGGFVAIVRGSSLPTQDIDIVPSHVPVESCR